MLSRRQNGGCLRQFHGGLGVEAERFVQAVLRHFHMWHAVYVSGGGGFD